MSLPAWDVFRSHPGVADSCARAASGHADAPLRARDEFAPSHA